MSEEKKNTTTEEKATTEQEGVLTLKKPIELDGEKVDKIAYDLDSLTGNDIERAITELGKKGIIVAMSETDQRYHAMIFAIAAGIAYEDVTRLSAKDFSKAVNAVRDFFLEE